MGTNATDRRHRSQGEVGEEELLARARAGEAEACGELFARHRQFALHVALSVTRCRSDAEDAVGIALENTLRAMSRGGGPTHRFDHYLAVAVRRAAVRQFSGVRGRERPTEPAELHGLLADDAALVDDVVDQGLASDAFATLTKQDRDILWATEVAGWSPHDLGQQLGTSAGAVAARSYRARKRLRHAFLLAVIDQHLPPFGRSARDRATPAA